MVGTRCPPDMQYVGVRFPSDTNGNILCLTAFPGGSEPTLRTVGSGLAIYKKNAFAMFKKTSSVHRPMVKVIIVTFVVSPKSLHDIRYSAVAGVCARSSWW